MAGVRVSDAAPNAPACLTAPPGLVSWWPGDRNEHDVLGGNNPSQVVAVTLVPGEVLKGFTFGTDGIIQIPAASNLANQQFTWAAWVRPDGPGPYNDSWGSIIVSQNISSSYSSVQFNWRATDGRFLFMFGDADSDIIWSADAFPPGSFYLVAGTYDGSTFQLFVNGVLEGSLAEVKTVQYSSPWAIGSATIINRTWNGVIDEVQAFNRALSLSEIQAIYNAGSAGTCKE
jgi:hypothetical protein